MAVLQQGNAPIAQSPIIAQPTTPQERMQVVAAVAITAIALAPFVTRAFNVDEPLFIWAAQQIRHKPLDFYGFPVNWYSTAGWMADVMKNPPLASYYLAMASKIFGWSEVGLHIAFWLPAIGLVVGVLRLARLFHSRAGEAWVVCLFSPVLLIAAISVMCDTLMLCFWVWAIVWWVRGVRDQRVGALFLGAALAGASALTKYFGISLLPLMVVIALTRRQRVGAWIAALMVPVIMLIAYQLWTQHLYGRGLLLDLFGYAGHMRGVYGAGRLAQLSAGISFTGGACLGMMPLLAMTASRRGWLTWAITAGAMVTLTVLADPFPNHSFHTEAGFEWWMFAQLTIFIAAGVAVLILCICETRTDSASLPLACWIFGTFFFAAFCNWCVNGRSILPMVPAVAIVLCRRLERSSAQDRPNSWRWWALAPAIILSMLCAAADTSWCNSTRQIARNIADETSQSDATLYINGHWGFQYYLQQRGAVPLDGRHVKPYRGDVIASALNNNTNVIPLHFPPGTVEPIAQFNSVAFPFLTTLSVGSHAGFYADPYGPLPYAFGPVLPDPYELVRFIAPNLPLRGAKAAP